MFRTASTLEACEANRDSFPYTDNLFPRIFDATYECLMDSAYNPDQIVVENHAALSRQIFYFESQNKKRFLLLRSHGETKNETTDFS